MKNLYKSFVMIAAAAITFAGCTQKEILDSPKDGELVTLKFNIRNADENTVTATKALLGTENGKNFLNWEDGDKIGTFAVGSFGTGTSTSSTSNNNGGTVSVSGDDYTLNVQTFNAGTVTNIYSYYPFSAAAGKNKESVVINIPANQITDALGFDADAMPMAGAPVEVDLTTSANTDEPCGEITFSNLGSIINFKVYSSVSTDETITSVKYVSSTDNIGGNYTIDLTAINPSDASTLALSGNGSEKEITTTCKNNPTIGADKGSATDVYMVVAPGKYSGTQVVVTTNLRTYTLTASGEKEYLRSHVKPMYVNIQNGVPGELPVSEVWEKVTSVSDFTAGTYYILNHNETVYLPNDEAGSAPAAKSFEGIVTSDMRWKATVSDGGLIFKNPNSELYLWGQDGTNNGVRVKNAAPANTSANVWKFTSDSRLGIIASVGTQRYLGVYNNNGTFQDWRNYASSSLGDGTNTNNQGQVVASVNNSPAVFYKLTDSRKNSGLEWKSADGMADITSEGIDYALPSLTNPNGVTVSSYTSSNESVATVASDGTVTALAEGTTTISAIFDGDATYKPATVSYELEVTDSRTECAAPTFNPAAGAVEANTVVTISSSTEGATIYYTTNASVAFSTETWTAGNTVTIDAAKTIRAVAVKSGYKNSEESSAAYTIVGNTIPDPETITFSTLGLTNGVQYSDPFDGGNFTVTFAGGGNDGKYYTTGEAIRVYGGGTFTVASADYNISQIELTFGSGSGSNAITTNVGTFTSPTWTGSSKSVKFTVGGTSGHRRIASIKVTYGN